VRTSRVLPYLVLLQAGFTVPRTVTSRAVRSYRTFSPLPAKVQRQFPAVYFLWHFPWAHAPQALPGALSEGARTFLCRLLAYSDCLANSCSLGRGVYSITPLTGPIRQNYLTSYLSLSIMTIKLSLWSKRMPAERTDRAYEVTWLVRRLFRAMGAKADGYLASANLSAAERAVMEFLYPDQEMSVPDIARRYNVSRQHVQVTVNGLLAKDLLRSIDNPQHKRSHLTRLSGRGRKRFDEIRRHELTLIEQVFADIPDSALATTHETLSTLLQKFK